MRRSVWLFVSACLLSSTAVQCSGEEEVPDCYALGTRAHQAALELSASTDRGCAQDADCVLNEYALFCTGGCDALTAIAASANDAFVRAHRRLEAAQCVQLDEQGCEFIPPPCGSSFAGGREAACQDGQCQIRYVEL
jgi:hypothetical protein